MSPKAPDPELRAALIEAAARLLVEHGPDALTTRRLAAEVGTSTMAVYTYFEGMDELRASVAREGFDRLARSLDRVEHTRDPVADLTALGVAYFLTGVENPHLYRFMFLERPPEDPECGAETFERCVAGVKRVVDAGRFRGPDPEPLATQLWATLHGIVTLHLAGLLDMQEAVAAGSDAALSLYVGFGDDPRAARRSLERGRTRIGTELSPALG